MYVDLLEKIDNTIKKRIKPDNILHQEEEDYLCALDFSHIQSCYVPMPAYSSRLCNFDEQGSKECPHQLHRVDVINVKNYG